MMRNEKRITIFGLVVVGIATGLFSVFLWNVESESVLGSNPYHIVNCHVEREGNICGKETTGICDAMYLRTDECQKYLSCSRMGLVVKDPLFDSCYACLSGASSEKGCTEKFSDSKQSQIEYVSSLGKISFIISVVLVILGISFLVHLLYSIFLRVISRKDADTRTSNAMMTHAVIGLSLVVLAFAVLYLVEYFIARYS